MSFPTRLENLNPREAITDALYRATLGIDGNDRELFISALASDECSFVLRGEVTSGRDNVIESVFDRVGPMDTTHIISNLRIDYKEGAETASLTANAIAQHGRPGQGSDPSAPRFMSGGIYFVDVVKEGADWKLKRWELKVLWLQGDPTVMQG